MRECAPGYQQQIQGSANGLMKQISQNIPVADVDKWRVGMREKDSYMTR